MVYKRLAVIQSQEMSRMNERLDSLSDRVHDEHSVDR
jgi:hypothetical protein